MVNDFTLVLQNWREKIGLRISMCLFQDTMSDLLKPTSPLGSEAASHRQTKVREYINMCPSGGPMVGSYLHGVVTVVPLSRHWFTGGLCLGRPHTHSVLFIMSHGLS